LSGFIIPPLAVLLISGILALLALRQPIPARALAPAPTLPAANLVVTPSPAAAPVQPQPTPVTVYDGSGQPVSPASGSALPLYQTVLSEQAPTPAPVWNIFPQIQAVIVTALADQNPQPAAVPSGSLAAFFRPEVLHWSDSILRWSGQAGVDPNLAAVVMQIESCGDPRALSHSGAIGLFQVMPFHFRGGDDAYDPDTNALRGLSYLARSMQAAGGDARLALAGYNGGIGVISGGESAWPAETQRYVYFGGPIYEDARSGATQSPALDEWYNRYGVSLCRHAAENQ
jgi:soluble lytic murein transglycosylase-like protein